MKIYLIAGEESGDLISSKIITNIKQTNPTIEFIGIGGNNMLNTGLTSSLFPIEKINLFGLLEIIPHIFRLHLLINKTVKDILLHQPDILITVDSPGFCFRVAKKIKKLAPSIKRIHIVAPSVWAYKPKRAIQIASIYHHLLTLLEFEPPFFEKYGLKSSYIGHPIFEQDFNSFSEQDVEQFKTDNNLTHNTIAITPGSRKSEISRHLPLFLKAITFADLSDVTCIIISTNNKHHDLIQQIIKKYKVSCIISEQKILAFKAAKLVLAKSGTNNLEIAATERAMIVGYKMNFLTFWLLKKVIKIKYASLINIIANKEIIPELIQDNMTYQNLAQKLNELLNDEQLRKTQIEQNVAIIKKMGFDTKSCPSQQAAKIILDYI